MKKVIAKFEPVFNTIWYDIREITYIDNSNINIQIIKSDEYKDKLDSLPIFKPKARIKKSAYYKQFIKYFNNLNLND